MNDNKKSIVLKSPHAFSRQYLRAPYSTLSLQDWGRNSLYETAWSNHKWHMGKVWFITQPCLCKLVTEQQNNEWLKFQLHFPAGQLLFVCIKKDQIKQEVIMHSPTYSSRLYGVCTVLLYSLASCLIMYKEPQKQICWYYGFFQTRSFFLRVLCHQSRASHKWLGYEHILDQALWHLPMK